MESEEVAQARKQRIAEALSRYKQTSGTIVDASVEAAAQVSPELGRPESMRWIQFHKMDTIRNISAHFLRPSSWLAWCK